MTKGESVFIDQMLSSQERVQEGDSKKLTAAALLASAEKALQPIEEWLLKSTCLVVGPGLGRDPVMLQTAQLGIESARKKVCSVFCAMCALFTLRPKRPQCLPC